MPAVLQESQRTDGPAIRPARQATPNLPSPVYLDEFQVEAIYGVRVARLRKMRCERIGPPYVSMPRFVRYKASDIEAWLESHKIEAADKPFTDGRGRPRKDGSPANAATRSARRVAEQKQVKAQRG